METARTLNMPAMLVAIALFAFCAATVIFQQTALSRTQASATRDESQPQAGAAFPPKGEVNLEQVVRHCRVELDNGSLDVQVADSGPGRVSWEVIGKPGVSPEQLELKVSEADGVVMIEDEWHGATRVKKPEVQVRVWLPITTDLEVALGNGDLTSALDGGLKTAVGNGTVQLSGSPSMLEASIGNGELTGGARLNTGEHAVHVGNGSIDLKLLPGSDAQLHASTAVGQVQTTGLPGQAVKHDWVGSSYNGAVGKGAARVVLEVGHGDVQLSSAGS